MPNAAIEVAKREFLEHVLSWRFLIALALSTLILVTSVLALSAAYRDDLESYNGRQQELGEQEGSFSTTAREIHRHLARPNVLSIFVGGPGDTYRSKASDQQEGITIGGPRFEPDSGSSSPANTRFRPLDLAFVGAVVMSFMAVLFSFDAVSGEKERGTLKLMLANPIPKDSVLIGKYLGGIASILAAFGLSLVVGLATVSLVGVSLDGESWIRLAAIVGVLMLMLSAFYLLGLLVSSLSRRSSTSLLVLTLIWLVLVFGAGNVSAVVAKETGPEHSSAEMQERMRALNDAANADAEGIHQELFPLMQKRFSGGNLTAAEDARMKELQARLDEIFDAVGAERDRLRSDSLAKLDGELRRAESLAAVSPAEAFRSIATSIARSDYWSYRATTDAAEAYQREVRRAMEEWQVDNPGGGGANVVVIGNGAVTATSDGGFEPPAFHYTQAALSDQLGSARAVRDLVVLLAYNLGAFVAAYVAFVRYDVR